MKIVVEVNGRIVLSVWGSISPASIQTLLDLIAILVALVNLMEGFQRLIGM